MKTDPNNEAEVYRLCPGPPMTKCLTPLLGDQDLCGRCAPLQQALFEGWDQEGEDLKRADDLAMQHAYGFGPIAIH